MFYVDNRRPALLVIKDAKRSDTGPYSVTLKNASGTAEATVKVTVLGMYVAYDSN
jgi:hypothetical protein